MWQLIIFVFPLGLTRKKIKCFIISFVGNFKNKICFQCLYEILPFVQIV